MQFQPRVALHALILSWLLMGLAPVQAALLFDRKTKQLEEHEFYELCSHVRFRNMAILDFTEIEKTLVCGTSKKELQSWSDVPLSQAQLFLRGFLEKRGFHRPQFSVEDNALTVDPGRQSKIKAIGFSGTPPEMDPSRRWDLIGFPMQPSNLDEIEEWARTQLRIHGYPCGEVHVRADPESDEVTVTLKPGARKYLLGVNENLQGALEPQVLSRFSAFRVSDPYNLDLLNLTRSRITSDGIVQNAFFDVSCSEAGENDVYLRESIIPGPTNLFKAGVGFTRDRPEINASWQKHRTNKYGSMTALSASATVNEQMIQGSLKRYFDPSLPRLFAQPQLTLKFTRESYYSTRDSIAQYWLGYQWDTSKESILTTVGPGLRANWSNRDGTSSTNRIVALEAHTRYMTHDYEQFLLSPRQGLQTQLDASTSDPEINSDIRAHQLRLQGHYLYNYLRFDPPRLIVGLRWSLATTWSDDRSLNRLPPSDYLYELGGTQDMRGFDRKAFPGSEQIRLTSAYVGGELRWYKLLLRRFDPFLLADIGRLGRHSLTLDHETYTSYGIGARWESPVGVLRLYVAQGFVNNTPYGVPTPPVVTRLGFSFGEEF